MKKWILLLLVLVAAGGGGYYYYAYGNVPEKPQIVQVAVSEGDVVEVVQATGTLEAVRTFDVGSQVSGIVRDIHADFNSIVHKGQLIAEIDPSLLEVQVQLQNANVERQQGEIANIQVQLENDQRQFERTKQLFAKLLVNQQQLEQAELTVKTRQTQVESAKKQLMTAEANLNQAELNLSYTKIYSPIDGVVVNRRVDVGQAVQASMTTPQFFQLATDLRQLKLTAGVDEADVGKVRRGMTVQFAVDSYANQTFTGTVDAVRLNAQTQNNVVTYPVWVNVPNNELKLKPFMTAQVRIIISTAQSVVRIPNQALRFRPTTDMYTALGLTPPPPGQGRGRAAGRMTEAGNGAAGRAADAGAPAAAPARPAGSQAGRGQGAPQAAAASQAGSQTARRGGRGFGGNFANLSPEEQQRLKEQFGGRRGRGGRGAAPSANESVVPVALQGEKIDDLFDAPPRRIQPGAVWTWDEPSRKLTEIRVQVGVTDGQFSEMVSGDLQAGQQVLTAILLPQTSAQRQQSIFGQPQFGGRGGLQPGGGRGGGGRGGG
jgi:HlyD family secretion protein